MGLFQTHLEFMNTWDQKRLQNKMILAKKFFNISLILYSTYNKDNMIRIACSKFIQKIRYCAGENKKFLLTSEKVYESGL
jgi:hypothetical protein